MMAYPQGGGCANRLIPHLCWTKSQDSAWQKWSQSSSSSGYEPPVQPQPQWVLPLPPLASSSSSLGGEEAQRDS